MKKPAEIKLQLLFNDLLDEYTDSKYFEVTITAELPMELVNFISAYETPNISVYDRMRAEAVIGSIIVNSIRDMRKNPKLWNIDDDL